MYRGQLESLQHQLIEVGNTIGIFIWEDVEEEFARFLDYDSRLATGTTKPKFHKELCSVSFHGAPMAASPNEFQEGQRRRRSSVKLPKDSSHGLR